MCIRDSDSTARETKAVGVRCALYVFGHRCGTQDRLSQRSEVDAGGLARGGDVIHDDAAGTGTRGGHGVECRAGGDCATGDGLAIDLSLIHI